MSYDTRPWYETGSSLLSWERLRRSCSFLSHTFKSVMGLNRTRSRSGGSQITGLNQCYSRSSELSPWSSTWVTPKVDPSWFSETIEDESGPKAPFQVRPCLHTRTWGVNKGIPFDSPPRYNPDGTLYAQYKNAGAYGYNFYSMPPLYGLTSASSRASTYFMKGLGSMTDHVPAKASIPNTLLELRELADFVRVARFFESLGPKRLGDTLKAYKAGGASFRKEVANAWLTYSFGVKPLLNDLDTAMGGVEVMDAFGVITKSLGTSARVAKRLSFLKKTYGKPTKFRRTAPLITESKTSRNWYYDHLIGGVYPFGDNICQVWLMHEFSHSTVASYGGTMVQRLQGLDDADRAYKAYLADLGFLDLFRTAWDALPWSFLVDYFSGIGDFIDSLPAMPVFDGAIHLQDTWNTTKQEIECRIHAKTYNVYNDAWSNPAVCAVISQRNFQRGVGITTPWGPYLSGFQNSTQIANVAALFAGM